MQPITLPVLWYGEENKITLALLDASDDPVTGMGYSQIAARCTRESDTDMVDISPAIDEWSERGDGMYALTVPGAILNEVGMFGLYVEPVSGAVPIRGIGYCDKRPETRILSAMVTGYGVNTVGLAIENAEEYKVHVSPQYDYVNSKVDFVVWLEKGGRMISDPTSCRVIMKKKEPLGDTVIADATNASPDSEGFMYIQVSDIGLTANKNYALYASVVYNGVTYSSGAGVQSLN